LEGFHESLGSGLGNSSEVVNQFLFGHSDTGIPKGEGVVGFIGNDSNSEAGFEVESGRFGVGNGLVSDFVEGIRGIGNELSQENFLVGIKGVDDESGKFFKMNRNI